MELFQYMFDHLPQVYELLVQHIVLTAVSVGIAILIGVPLGILISYIHPMKKPVLAFTNLMQAIPSMALLGFIIPFMGIGQTPAIFAVVLYSLLPIVKNTYIGVSQISPETIEVAKGIGMTRGQILRKIQLPLTLPVLMAGIRIAAVLAVGLMTIAAYIGAGGLGYLVFTGISVVNNGMIIAGAIPAALLALLLDGLLGFVEELVTPISLQPKALANRKAFYKTKRLKQGFVTVVGILLIGLIGHNIYVTNVHEDNEIVLATKPFTEQQILGYMVKDMLEQDGNVHVIPKFGVGSTSVIQSAMQKGDIDMYIDYTGTMYVSVLKHDKIPSAEEVYKQTKEKMKEDYGQILLNPFNFENTYAIAVTQETAKKYNLETLSDLARVSPNLVLGMTLETLNRPDGYPGLKETYGMNFKNAIGLNGSNRYVALLSDKTQVMDAYSTDGLLRKYDLKVLKDDKHFFPPYYAVPVVRQEVLNQYPQIAPIMDKLGPVLTYKKMQELNYRVDQLHESPETVARQFLQQEGLLK